MTFWTAGLATKRSAERASKWGGAACLVQAARMTLGNIVSITGADKALDNAIVWFIGASIIPVLFVLAGMRLWRGEGRISGTLAALILVFDFAIYGPEPTSSSAIGTLVMRGVLFILIANGVRGALALRNQSKVTCS